MPKRRMTSRVLPTPEPLPLTEVTIPPSITLDRKTIVFPNPVQGIPYGVPSEMRLDWLTVANLEVKHNEMMKPIRTRMLFQRDGSVIRTELSIYLGTAAHIELHAQFSNLLIKAFLKEREDGSFELKAIARECMCAILWGTARGIFMTQDVPPKMVPIIDLSLVIDAHDYIEIPEPEIPHLQIA